MKMIAFDYTNSFIKEHELEVLGEQVKHIHNSMHKKEGIGSDCLGWLDYPLNYDKDEFERVKQASQKIKSNSDILLVIGIGGSYIGARCVIEALGHSFYDLLPNDKKGGPKVLFVGNNLSSTYISDLLEAIEDKDVSVNVISKSGTTTEPAIAFRIIKKYLYNKYGESAKERIYVTTDKTEGSLRKLSAEEGYEAFTVPDDIGGRYSVLTSVGLLPIVVGGANIDLLMKGAAHAVERYNTDNINENDCYKYAVVRNILNRKGKEVEILATYEPHLDCFSEWWKQLFGESEGKDSKGMLPVSVSYSTDLHSLGQYIQDGRRNIFETVLNIEKPKKEIYINEDKDDIDGLNYLHGKSIDYVNKKAMEGTIQAHCEGGVPNLIINIPKINEYYLGQLIYFFEKACAMSGYLLGVNPFDQPGVEAYKSHMFKLLGKGKGR